jgi:hypothetical protein
MARDCFVAVVVSRRNDNSFGVQGALKSKADIRLLKEQMEKFVLPRHLTEKQQALMAYYLNNFDSHEYVMKVADGDNEASNFAADVMTALQKAGWMRRSIDYVKDMREGVALIEIDDNSQNGAPNDPRRPNPVILLQQAFGQYGIQIDSTSGGNGQSKAVEIDIGGRRRD